jgi:trk system potassium uptake protein
LFGGCSGSTSGGLKMWRLQLIISDIKNALDLLLHPQAVFSDSDWSNLDNHLACRLSRGFFALYCLILLFGVFVLSLTGLSMSGAFSAAIASISNTGAGVGEVSQGYASLSSSSKVVMIILMLAGRLEILPILLVLRGLHPKSWLRYIR